MSDILFNSYKMGDIQLKNRFVMAPMTRCRAIENKPNDLMALYYSQRAEAGLIVTEGASPSPAGLGYARIPGIFSKDQIAGWKKVTKAVHDAGSKIFLQMMHTGRVSHSLNLPSNSKIVAPSATMAPGKMWTDQQGMQDFPVAHEMSESEIETTINEFVLGAKNAIEAGFDGVEIHGANGYLVDQFINTVSNKRKDKWGGSIENRIRFAVEVTKRVATAIGAKKVGIRLSPFGVFNGMETDTEHELVFTALAKELSNIGIVYLHLVDHSSMGAPVVPESMKNKIRENFKHTLILSGGYDKERAEKDLDDKKGELVAFGRLFISNPKLVTKFKNNQPLVNLTAESQNTFYSSNEIGYTDYV